MRSGSRSRQAEYQSHQSNAAYIQTMSCRTNPSLGLIQKRFRWTKWNATLHQTSATLITVYPWQFLSNYTILL